MTTSASAEDDVAGVTFNVLSNDADVDVGDTLAVSSHNGSAIASGTLTDNGGGSFTYVPDSDFVGSETFSYTVTDGNGGDGDCGRDPQRHLVDPTRPTPPTTRTRRPRPPRLLLGLPASSLTTPTRTETP